MKSPEQFDFSKLEDQQKFEKLSKEKHEEHIEKSHEEGLGIEENIQNIGNVGLSLSFEETELAKGYIFSGMEAKEAVVNAKREAGWREIKQFNNKDVKEFRKEGEKQLKETIKNMQELFSGQTIYEGIHISSSRKFFEYIKPRLAVSNDIFKDKETLKIIADEIIKFHLKNESHDEGDLAKALIQSGELMASLGFYEEAYYFYEKTKDNHLHPLTQMNWPTEYRESGILNLLKSYKLSGQHSDRIEKIFQKHVNEILKDAGTFDVQAYVITKPFPLIKREYGYITHKLDIYKQITKAMQDLSWIGIPEDHQKQLLEKTLIAGANTLLERCKEKAAEGSYWPDTRLGHILPFINQVIELYELTGNKQKGVELIVDYLNNDLLKKSEEEFKNFERESSKERQQKGIQKIKDKIQELKNTDK